ncbi:unnamed protein product [Orchesella dallaii]|uniref:Transmembrane protein INAFM2 n=1 Tax=Orchesella dallaii TaxID=48710 RepID=A0ABP1QXD4_9HEXA
MGKESRRSLGGSNGDISGQVADMQSSSKSAGKSGETSKIMRILTVIAYVIGVSSGAALLSAYYIFLWVPHPTSPMQRPTDSPFSLAQHGNTHLAGGSHYHYQNKISYPNSLDKTNYQPVRASKRASKTTPSPHLPKPQYLLRNPAYQTTLRPGRGQPYQ